MGEKVLGNFGLSLGEQFIKKRELDRIGRLRELKIHLSRIELPRAADLITKPTF